MLFVRSHSSSVPAAYATRYIFLALGLAISVWAVLVPFAKTRMALDPALLGSLLLLIGTGAIVSMPIAGFLTTRFGCRKVLNISTIIFLLTIIGLACVTEVWLFACLLFIFGVSSGVVDVAMNIHAMLVEKLAQKSMMSGFHGMYSIGGCIGAVVLAFLLQSGLTPFAATTGFMLLLLVTFLLFFARHLLPYGSKEKSEKRFVFPRGVVLLMGVLCFVLYMCDGIVLDWGALYMNQCQGVPERSAGLVFSVYSVAISIGRMFGDKLTDRFGMRKVMMTSALIAFVGCVCILLVSGTVASFIAFMIVGLGASNLIPLLFTVATHQKVMPTSLAVSTVTTLGYLGMMVGPPVMGYVAYVSSLAMIFAIVASLFVFVMIASKNLQDL